MLAGCKKFGHRRLHYAELRFVPQQEHLFRTTGTLVQEHRNRNTGTLVPSLLWHFYISSFLFQFVLSENNFKKASRKWWTLVLCSGNTSLTLNCQRIQCCDYIKHITQTNTMAARGHGTSTYAPSKTRNWEYSRLENKRTAKYVYKYLRYPFLNLHTLKFWNTKYAQIVQVKRSATVFKLPYPWPLFRFTGGSHDSRKTTNLLEEQLVWDGDRTSQHGVDLGQAVWWHGCHDVQHLFLVVNRSHQTWHTYTNTLVSNWTLTSCQPRRVTSGQLT